MKLNRRAFLFGAGATVMAVQAGISLRKVPFLWGDGLHDDTDALNAFFRGEKIESSAGVFVSQNSLSDGKFLVSRPILIKDRQERMSVDGCHFVTSSDWCGDRILKIENSPNSTFSSVTAYSGGFDFYGGKHFDFRAGSGS